MLFVNTKMKVLNPNWEKIGITPVEIQLRNTLGVAIDKEAIPTHIAATVNDLLQNSEKYRKQIDDCYEQFIFNHGCAGKEGAKYIVKSLLKAQNNKR